MAVILDLLDETLAVDHRPDIGIFVGDSHYDCAPMVEGLQVVFVLDIDAEPTQTRPVTPLRHRLGDGAGADLSHLRRLLPDRVQLPRPTRTWKPAACQARRTSRRIPHDPLAASSCHPDPTEKPEAPEMRFWGDFKAPSPGTWQTHLEKQLFVQYRTLVDVV